MKTTHFWIALALLCAFSLSAHAGDETFFSSRNQFGWFDCIESDEQPNTFYPEPTRPGPSHCYASLSS